MSKQDRQGVRTPADVERKYDLGEIRREVEKLAKARTITFAIGEKVYTAEDGMSWSEWVGSTHSRGEYSVDGVEIKPKASNGRVYFETLKVFRDDIILGYHVYLTLEN